MLRERSNALVAAARAERLASTDLSIALASEAQGAKKAATSARVETYASQMTVQILSTVDAFICLSHELVNNRRNMTAVRRAGSMTEMGGAEGNPQQLCGVVWFKQKRPHHQEIDVWRAMCSECGSGLLHVDQCLFEVCSRFERDGSAVAAVVLLHGA